MRKSTPLGGMLGNYLQAIDHPLGIVFVFLFCHEVVEFEDYVIDIVLAVPWDIFIGHWFIFEVLLSISFSPVGYMVFDSIVFVIDIEVLVSVADPCPALEFFHTVPYIYGCVVWGFFDVYWYPFSARR